MEESHHTDLRYREKLGKELQSEKEGGEASGFGSCPERGSRGLNVEMMLLPALGGGSEASKRGPTPAGRRAVERQMGTGWLVPSQQGLGPQLLME